MARVACYMSAHYLYQASSSLSQTDGTVLTGQSSSSSSSGSKAFSVKWLRRDADTASRKRSHCNASLYSTQRNSEYMVKMSTPVRILVRVVHFFPGGVSAPLLLLVGVGVPGGSGCAFHWPCCCFDSDFCATCIIILVVAILQ